MRYFPAVIVLMWAMGNCPAQLSLRQDVKIPDLPGFRPLPAPDPAFSEEIRKMVEETRLDEKTPAEENPDKVDEWSSICVVDITDMEHPRMGGWKEDNFIYPASSYKLYVLGEIIRQVVSGEHQLDEKIKVKKHNVRGGSKLEADQEVSLSEVLRLMLMYSDNTAANEAIDLADRQRASALLRAMGCRGSDITRKYLSRSLEDDGYTSVPSTTSCALHFATFLWAVEQGAVGGGRGRALIKGYMGMDSTTDRRIRGGVPASASIYSKTGTWDTFTSEVAIVEEGNIRYILCVLTPFREKKAEPRMAAFATRIHERIKSLHQKSNSIKSID